MGVLFKNLKEGLVIENGPLLVCVRYLIKKIMKLISRGEKNREICLSLVNFSIMLTEKRI